MANVMPCGKDDERLWDRYSADHMAALAVEQKVDDMLSIAKYMATASWMNTEYDLYDGALLPSLMVEIANWDGSSESAGKQIRKLHNLLADAFQKVAEREVNK